MKQTLFFLVLWLFAPNVFGGYAEVSWQDAAKPPLKVNDISVCGQPKMVDLRVSYSLNSGFIIGEPDPNCPWGFGPNPFRYTVQLYRDATLLGSHQFQLAGCWFRDWFVSVSALPGVYYAKIKMERRTAPWVWVDEDSMNSKGVTAVKLKATPNFTVNGKAVPADGSAIVVKLANAITINGALTTCATRYVIGAEESDQWWNRTYHYEWNRWFDGAPPADINLQSLATTYSVLPYWLGNESSRQATPLFGGNLPNGAARHYRVGICTNEPSSECKHVLLRVE